MASWLTTLRSALGIGPRVSGLPTSSNGASSLHLTWELGPVDPADPIVELAVSLEVLRPSQVDRLYFWALQADFADERGRRAGGAHLGLQWHPAYPGCTAANWGGYDAGGAELAGSPLAAPSAAGNPNTCDHRWAAGRPHRLTITRVEGPSAAPPGTVAWRGAVGDPGRGEGLALRDLWVPGDRVVGAVVWSEVFARCDDPPTEVRWSNPLAVTASGRQLIPASARVDYQTRADGGCDNTTSLAGDHGLHQMTATERTTPQGAVLGWPNRHRED